MTWRIIEGDCIEVMAAMEAASVDAIVTDPPYLIGFMGKEFDTQHKSFVERKSNRRAGSFEAAHGNHNPRDSQDQQRTRLAEGQRAQAWHEAWACEALRVLKPGGHLLAFGGTRTYHRLTCAIEDAGFEIRDCIAWIYGSGFPKSLDVSKAIDKAAGARREIVGKSARHIAQGDAASSSVYAQDEWTQTNGRMGEFITAPATQDAERWQGWGTALKPAHEPIVVARKPLAGTVAANVLAHGTGALNVDGCRVAVDDEAYARNHSGDRGHDGTRSIEERGATDLRPGGGSASAVGRWPANVVLDGKAAAMLDEQTGELTSGRLLTHHQRSGAAPIGTFEIRDRTGEPCDFGGDSGGASRFFYCAKADSAERHAGLGTAGASLFSTGDEPEVNNHPTVKPIALMRWLVRLVTPPGGTVLDPFAGSGTTGCAATLEGFDFIGVEREAEYAAIARARIGYWSSGAGQVAA